MVYRTLEHTKKATFAVGVPYGDPKYHDYIFKPNGTGFFVSDNGYFITARHVIEKKANNKKGCLHDEFDIVIIKPSSSTIKHIEIKKDFKSYDLVLLKIDIEKNKEKFDFLEICYETKPEGKPVYSFGYPLLEESSREQEYPLTNERFYFPRTTSAIISSHCKQIPSGKFIKKNNFPEYYIIDKALHPGNSGGPIIDTENGKVFAVCVRYNKVYVIKDELKLPIPSSYSIAISLKNIQDKLLEII